MMKYVACILNYTTLCIVVFITASAVPASSQEPISTDYILDESYFDQIDYAKRRPPTADTLTIRIAAFKTANFNNIADIFGDDPIVNIETQLDFFRTIISNSYDEGIGSSE